MDKEREIFLYCLVSDGKTVSRCAFDVGKDQWIDSGDPSNETTYTVTVTGEQRDWEELVTRDDARLLVQQNRLGITGYLPFLASHSEMLVRTMPEASRRLRIGYVGDSSEC